MTVWQIFTKIDTFIENKQIFIFYAHTFISQIECALRCPTVCKRKGKSCHNPIVKRVPMNNDKDQLSLTNPRNAFHHGERAANK